MTIIEFEERAKYQGGYDRVMNHWRVIDTHQIPHDFKENTELDFYCSNEKRVYLLRLRYCEIESYVVNDESKSLGYPPYLIAEFPIQYIDDEIIKTVLNKFNLE